MKSANIPHLYSRNGIYYYRNNAVWKSLKTRCKKEAFLKLSNLLVNPKIKLESEKNKLHFSSLITAYLNENSIRWSEREFKRIQTALSHLPARIINKDIAIKLKQSLLREKSVTTFNRYLNYYNSLYKWIIANNTNVTVNPFDGLKIIEGKKSVSNLRKAYNKSQLEIIYKFAEQFGKNDKRYWLIMIGRYTGARMNEICQLKPQDVTQNVIYIRGEILKSQNSYRTLPMHQKLIELGILNWVEQCTGERLFHEWSPVKGSFSHHASKWFSRNNPFRNYNGVADVDFHSLRHTVATELKQLGIPNQYAAQILGHSNGNITYDRYGKVINHEDLKIAMNSIGQKDYLISTN